MPPGVDGLADGAGALGVPVALDGAGVLGAADVAGLLAVADGEVGRVVGPVPESAPPQPVRRSAARPSETVPRPAAPPALHDLRTWLCPSRNA